jgi:hypothetical protein
MNIKRTGSIINDIINDDDHVYNDSFQVQTNFSSIHLNKNKNSHSFSPSTKLFIN